MRGCGGLLGEVDNALSVSRWQRRVCRLEVQASQQHYHKVMAGQALANAIGGTNLARPPQGFMPRDSRECDVVRRYEPVFINDAVARGEDTLALGRR